MTAVETRNFLKREIDFLPENVLLLVKEFVVKHKAMPEIPAEEQVKKSASPNRAERFAGALKLSEQQYQDFSESITQSRNEWNRSIY